MGKRESWDLHMHVMLQDPQKSSGWLKGNEVVAILGAAADLVPMELIASLLGMDDVMAKAGSISCTRYMAPKSSCIYSMLAMGNEKANIYCEAELPPNYDRVGIEISSLQSMRIRGGSLRMRRRFKKGGPQGDNNDIVTEVVMAMSAARLSIPLPARGPEQVSPGEGALPHQTSQMTQPIAVAESVKQVAEVVNPPKVDIATDLFDMLSMDSPNDNGASAASVDDNSWRAFQPVEEELATKSGVAKADHRKCQSSSAIDGLFKDSSTLSSSISTSSLSDKPPKDVKNDIMNLFDKKVRICSP
ncbi:hypothetical protein P3L10_018609 [Capsicum annuum]